ncbi:hypothetical protein LTR95_011854 [Oleoguttula sp. CCFEE 5521]
MAPPPIATLVCVWCGDEWTEPGYRPEGSDHDPKNGMICKDCAIDAILPLFQQAYEDGSKYPPKWGGTKLLTTDFEDLFPDGFLEEWRLKVANEYSVDAGKRAYCGYKTTNEDGDTELCNGYLGEKGQGGTIRRRYLLHASKAKAPVNAIVRTGFLAQMRQDRRLLDTIPADHEVRKAAAPDTTRVVRDVAWMFSCFEHFHKFIDEPETRASSAAFAEVRGRLLMMRSMIQFMGEYELCHQPFSAFVDVAYIFMALLLKVSGKALGISFKPAALDVDLEFVLNEKGLQLFRNDVLHLGAGWVDKVKAMLQTHAATLRFQPRIRLYTQHLIADLLWMTTAVEKLAEAEGSVHPRIRSAFGHTHFEISIIDGIMRSSKLTILGPVLEVLTAYMQWGSIMLTQFVIVPDAAVTKGLGDPRNIQGFTEFTKGMHDKTIRDLRVLGLPTSGPMARKAWPTNSDKPFIVVHTLDRLLLFRESMMNAMSTRHDLGRAKMFVDDIHEVLSTCAQLFADDVFANYDRNTWPSRKSVWDLLKALSEWHDDIGIHIALHVLPSSQANVRPFERYMSLAPWDAGPETDMTVTYREIHRTVRDGPTQANDREAEFKSMQIG